ncbi:hypothetical protein [Paenibacillus sp. 481]|uniref:hypothetical protein n=1 Tax=Paenibacillus sp. 481 TaxID=2835869 RepID=UPI001E3C8170|nr:hypothetical protein [Paenibacillus sp. 481]UHA75201.1 hypothetical protein KIK04_09345 [Paenibacillus sp. 481]
MDNWVLLIGVGIVYTVCVVAIWTWLVVTHWRDWPIQKRRVLLVVMWAVPIAGVMLALVVTWAARHGERDQAGEGKSWTSRFSYLVVRGESGDSLSHRLYMKQEQAQETLPLEEALLFSDVMVRRRRLLDAIKFDAIERTSLLEAAVSNEDTETSHYAVTAVMEMKRKMTLALQEAAVRTTREPHNVEALRQHADLLTRCLQSALLDRRTYSIYRNQLAVVLEQWLAVGEAGAEAYERKISVELELGHHAKALQWCERFQTAHGDKEAPYLCALKVHYALRNGRAFAAQLEQFKRTGIRFSPDTLQLVRYWSREVKSDATAGEPAR